MRRDLRDFDEEFVSTAVVEGVAANLKGLKFGIRVFDDGNERC